MSRPFSLQNVGRPQLIEAFLRTYHLDQALYASLSQKALYYKYEPLRHPLIFYLGHTATFYINKMILGGLITQRVNPRFQSMFAVGVDEMDWDDLNESHYDFPTYEQLLEYRQKVKGVVMEWIEKNHPQNKKIKWQDPSWIIVMGIQHQNIHIQTSSVLIRTVDLQEVKSLSPLPPVCTQRRLVPSEVPHNQLLQVPGISRPWPKQIQTSSHYGWDVQFGNYQLKCKNFLAGKFLVSNAQYLPFVQAGGYEKNQFWEDEGRLWLKSRRKPHPFFWVKHQSTYRYRTIFQEIDMPWDWPVDVNFHQAKAFCNWKKASTGKPYRLPNQDQWFALRDLLEDDVFTWPKGKTGNINLEGWGSSCPVDKFGHKGFYDIVGNVWQWCQTPVNSFDNYIVHPYYQDFSSPTFDQRHNLIFGGSFISVGNLAYKEARYAFRRHFYQHAGFRYVVTDAPINTRPQRIYQSDEQSNQYLEFHFGSKVYFGVPNFPKACADFCIEMNQKYKGNWNKALDLGCAVGRSTFQLARRFKDSLGIDFSVRFFQLAVKLIERKSLKYTVALQGKLREKNEINMQELGLQQTKKNVRFLQQDATILDVKKINQVDLVFCGNLIDRMATPKVFLRNIHKHISSKGILIITSPYTWLENWTKCSQWVGGYQDQTGKQVSTFQGLKSILGQQFQLLEERDIPFVIRETARKHQHTVAHATCWRRLR